VAAFLGAWAEVCQLNDHRSTDRLPPRGKTTGIEIELTFAGSIDPSGLTGAVKKIGRECRVRDNQIEEIDLLFESRLRRRPQASR
jgi:hypothetical protein